jgi:hypothetical protein
MLTKQQSAGFSLLEVVLSIFVVTVGIAGTYAFLQGTIASESVIRDKLIASYLAQEGVEIVRNFRDTNYLKMLNGVGGVTWLTGLTGCSPGPCQADYNDSALAAGAGTLAIAGSGLYYYGAGISTGFQRKIAVNNTALCPAPDCVEIQVDVAWTDRGNPHNVVVTTHLYKWFTP